MERRWTSTSTGDNGDTAIEAELLHPGRSPKQGLPTENEE